MFLLLLLSLLLLLLLLMLSKQFVEICNILSKEIDGTLISDAQRLVVVLIALIIHLLLM